MNFGVLKSKIEEKLLNAYVNNKFDKEIKTFNKLVLEDKTVSSLFYLYDELSSNKGLSNDMVNEFINESIKIYENKINKLSSKKILEIGKWVGNLKCENKYTQIDKLFSTDVLSLEEKIETRLKLAENLKRNPIVESENMELPLNTMVNIANKTIQQYIENLDESEKSELKNLLSENDKELEIKYNEDKELTIQKLNSLKETSDNEVVNKINESINKIKSESYSKLNYYRLKILKDSI
jgi:hypothetical protein